MRLFPSFSATTELTYHETDVQSSLPVDFSVFRKNASLFWFSAFYLYIANPIQICFFFRGAAPPMRRGRPARRCGCRALPVLMLCSFLRLNAALIRKTLVVSHHYQHPTTTRAAPLPHRISDAARQCGIVCSICDDS
ncbi:hypothetical protein Y032_0118g735 [Ancylostoma ceylanicum]|uniref:Uncharacterized protein n=1 Tax=Ancylostoma ceylanicum TaxID=53326 RepID=A0A016TBQ2_9BILA|nr:hypothetical protein Y032_0118g735 [Ancylostoma ceylanicum]